MANRSKNKNKVEWLFCKKCHTQFLCKESALHDDDMCRTIVGNNLINLENATHGFLSKYYINGKIQIVKREGVSKISIPQSKWKESIFLNPNVMKMSSIAIGDKVILLSNKLGNHLLTVWPSSLLSSASGLHPTTLVLTPDSDINVETETYGCVIFYPFPDIAITKLKLQLNCDHDYHDDRNFRSYVLKTLDSKYISINYKFNFHFFGQQCRLKVMEIRSKNEDLLMNANDMNSYQENSSRDEILNNTSEIEHLNFSSLNLNDSNLNRSDSIFTSTPKRILSNESYNTSIESCVAESFYFERFLNNSLPDNMKYFYVTENTIIDFISSSSSKASVETSKPQSNIFFSDIGALEDELIIIKDVFTLSNSQALSTFGISLPKNILLFGPPGTGKTMIGQAIANEIGFNFIVINGPEVYSKFFGETEANLRNIFADAENTAPSIIFVDEIDALCPKRDGVQNEQEKRVVSTLLSLLDRLSNSEKHVFVIAATNKPDSLDPAIRRPGRLDKEIEIGIPDPHGRFEILTKLLSKTQHKLTEEQIRLISEKCHGYTGADLSAICAEAGAHALNSEIKLAKLKNIDLQNDEAMNNLYVGFDHVSHALKLVKPSAMREVRLEIPKVYWSDIGGQTELKKKLKQAVEWPIKHPEAFARMGIKPPCGILMYGPPGCSKTMIAKALATESGLNFFSIKGPEIFSKWVGESERTVREVFRKARAASPSIIFFDEIDVLAAERGNSSGGTNVGDRVLTQLLTEMDGVEHLENVVIVAATNRPDMIDKALMRPGRLDRIMYIPLPDMESRKQIFKIQFKKTPVANDVSIEDLTLRTEGYSGAEIVSVCQEACLLAMEVDINVTSICKKYFVLALEKITPRIDPKSVEFYKNYQDLRCRF